MAGLQRCTFSDSQKETIALLRGDTHGGSPFRRLWWQSLGCTGESTDRGQQGGLKTIATVRA